MSKAQGLKFLPCFALTVFLLAACSADNPAYRGMDVSDVPWGGDFELTAHNGQRLKLSQLHGKYLILFFGYSHCPDICGPTLAKLAALSKMLVADSVHTQVIFVSLDPKHDTPAQLREFLARFDPNFIGLTGSESEIIAVAQDYKVAYHKKTSTPLIDHSGGVFIKDKQGRLRLYFNDSATAEDMLHDLRLLLLSKN